jgi:WD40 repeat protein
VQLYDAAALRKLQLLQPPSTSSGGAGFSDCQFTRSAPYSLAAAGYSGQVHLWDARASATARLALNAARGSGICSLQVSADGQYIHAASGTGHQVWAAWRAAPGACPACAAAAECAG